MKVTGISGTLTVSQLRAALEPFDDDAPVHIWDMAPAPRVQSMRKIDCIEMIAAPVHAYLMIGHSDMENV